jgi:hypothetical protein
VQGARCRGAGRQGARSERSRRRARRMNGCVRAEALWHATGTHHTEHAQTRPAILQPLLTLCTSYAHNSFARRQPVARCAINPRGCVPCPGLRPLNRASCHSASHSRPFVPRAARTPYFRGTPTGHRRRRARRRVKDQDGAGERNCNRADGDHCDANAALLLHRERRRHPLAGGRAHLQRVHRRVRSEHGHGALSLRFAKIEQKIKPPFVTIKIYTNQNFLMKKENYRAQCTII